MLTDVLVKKSKPQDKDYRLNDGDGLFLLIKKSGSKLWRYRRKIAGQEVLLGLGSYPEVSIQDARSKAREHNETAAKGIHPRAEEKDKAVRAKTFEELGREWFAYESPKWSDGHASKIIRRLETWVFPHIGNILISELKPLQVLECLRIAESKGRLETAGRQREYIQRICSYGILHGMIEQNPCTALGRGAIQSPKTKHMAAITDPRELAKLLRDIHDYRGRFTTKTAMILLSLLMCRTGELRRMEWSEIDFEAKEWRLPAEKMKMGQPHIVPLSRQAVEALTALKDITGHGRFAFPGQGKAEIMSENTVVYALNDMGYQGRHCGHGFRSTASTLLHERGYPSQWIEAQLSHKDPNAIRAAYNHTVYLADRRKMLQEWADYLDKLRESGKLIRLHPAANEE